MSLWEEPLCAKALIKMCICESFDLFDLPECVLREAKVEYKGFHHTDEDHSKQMATWLPKERLAVAFYVDSMQRTYVSIKGRLMLARAEAMLAHHLPARTIVLGHFVEDRFADGRVEPRVLLYDIAMHMGNDMQGVAADKRYAILRQMLSSSRGLFTLQWVGEASAASGKMAWFEKNIPHAVECVVSFGCNPWVLTRIMYVHVKNPASVPPKPA
eukprot:693744-Hanusia_phi.AAC.4